MKILHLVLYSPKPCYDEMLQATNRLYVNYSEQVTTFYYYRNPALSVVRLDGCMLQLPGEESYCPGILHKTIQALEMFDMRNFDFVVRSNASTVINFDVLLPLLEKEKLTAYYGGPHVMESKEITATDTVPREDLPLSFVHGTCIILRSDAVLFLCTHKHMCNLEINDDESIGLLFKQLQKEKPPCWLGKQYVSFAKTYNIDEILAFRNHHFHSDRKEDVSNVEHAAKVLKQRLAIKQTKPMVHCVRYHTKDITQQVLLLCKVNHHFTTDGNNSMLDYFFGDPAPGVVKTLHLEFDDKRIPFEQHATLTFQLSSHNTEKLQVV